MSSLLYFHICLILYGLWRVKNAKHITNLVFLLLISTVLCYAYITYCFISCNFTLDLASANTSTIVPIIYRISGVWANYEGSLFLFLVQITFITYVFIRKADLHNYKFAFYTQLLLVLSFHLFILFYADPFNANLSSQTEGVGMNPLLQDIGLVIHPPVLYFGYACCTIIFSGCINYLFTFENLKIILQFSRLAWAFLTAGVSLGSWWAYRELGWGGYWFFDPVENISLINWICVTAFHHSLLISIKQNRFLKSTIFLGLLSFMLILTGIMIIRSGLLISVHSFAFDSTRGFIMLGFVILLAFIISVIYSIQAQKIDGNHIKIYFFSKEFGIFAGTYLWLGNILILLSSIFIPIFVYIYQNNQISIEETYFHKIFIPSLIPVLIFTGSFAYFKAGKANLMQIIMSIAASVWLCIISKNIISGAVSISIMFSGCLIIINTTWQYIVKTRFFKDRLSFHSIGMLLSHLSIGALTLSILFNQKLQRNISFEGIVGDTIQTHDFAIKLHDVRYAKAENYLRQIAEFWIEDKSNNVIDLNPELRFYIIEDKITSDANIYSFVTHDLYAVIKNASKNETGGDVISADIYYKPCIFFIWLSCTGIALGIILSLFTGPRVSKIF